MNSDTSSSYCVEIKRRRMEPAKGIEPPTYGLRILSVPLILKRINKLALQNTNKSGKIRNPHATKTFL
jgi:hypothetical protein